MFEIGKRMAGLILINKIKIQKVKDKKYNNDGLPHSYSRKSLRKPSKMGRIIHRATTSVFQIFAPQPIIFPGKPKDSKKSGSKYHEHCDPIWQDLYGFE